MPKVHALRALWRRLHHGLTSSLALRSGTPAQRQAIGRLFVEADVILRQEPRTEPNRTKKSPAPASTLSASWIRQELYQTDTFFAQAYPRIMTKET